MLKTAAALFVTFLSTFTFADPVSYELQPYSVPGYSANWLHDATGCQHGALYMCGDTYELSGAFSGDLNGGVLSNISGELFANGVGIIQILDGQLGGAFDWFLETNLGVFAFENLNMGAGLPNIFDANSLVLWGQNEAAYCAGGSQQHCGVSASNIGSYGIDIHAVSVPEPGTFGILLLGLAGVIALRQRINNTARAI